MIWIIDHYAISPWSEWMPINHVVFSKAIAILKRLRWSRGQSAQTEKFPQLDTRSMKSGECPNDRMRPQGDMIGGNEASYLTFDSDLRNL